MARKSANSSNSTAYQSLPKTLNESVTSSISAISIDSTTHTVEERPAEHVAQLLGMTRQQQQQQQADSSTQQLIEETWADILTREQTGLPKDKRNLSRPDLTVTPISSVNSTLLRQDDTSASSIRTPSILRSSTTSVGNTSNSSKSVTFTDTVDVKEHWG